ncbi:MAG: FxDxF family PEP-CTERM protein [Proteobacteria bacterium]|nr:FxDxF family PEP-CTERM protein [Pseudomonadota bacterium]
MIQIFRKTTAAVVLACLACTVQAADGDVIGAGSNYYFGVLNVSKGVSVGDPINGFSGVFDNIFSFKRGAYPAATELVTGFDAMGDLTVNYRATSGFGDAPVWTGDFSPLSVPSNPDTGSFPFSQTISGLAAGQTYWFELKGSAAQAAYTVTLAPVPEPETWALMLSGCGLLGVISRRRRSSAA